jgi:hypothetical protein
MLLKYRGIQYEWIPTSINITEEKVIGHYRGVNWKSHLYNLPLLKQERKPLKYRGIEV